MTRRRIGFELPKQHVRRKRKAQIVRAEKGCVSVDALIISNLTVQEQPKTANAADNPWRTSEPDIQVYLRLPIFPRIA